jgi:hypothetical protein
MRRVISVAGLAVLIEAEDPAHWRALDAVFGSCPTAATDHGVVRLGFASVAPPAPERPADMTFTDVELWHTDTGVVTRHFDGIVVERHGDAIVAGGPASGEGAGAAVRGAAQHVLADAMADHGRFALHGAVVVDGGGAMLVIGDLASGPSASADAGWSVVADDIAWIAAADDGTSTVTSFPLPAPTERIDGDVAHRIRGIVIVRRGAPAATVVPFPIGPRLLTMVMRSFLLQGSPARVRQFFPVAAVLSHTPVVLLEHPIDSTAHRAGAATLLAEVSARFAVLDQ